MCLCLQDFTFVCPTEIIAFSERAKQFEQLNCQLIAASCDTEETHLAWIKTPRKKGGLGVMQIPILADTTKVYPARSCVPAFSSVSMHTMSGVGHLLLWASVVTSSTNAQVFLSSDQMQGVLLCQIPACLTAFSLQDSGSPCTTLDNLHGCLHSNAIMLADLDHCADAQHEGLQALKMLSASIIAMPTILMRNQECFTTEQYCSVTFCDCQPILGALAAFQSEKWELHYVSSSTMQELYRTSS